MIRMVVIRSTGGSYFGSIKRLQEPRAQAPANYVVSRTGSVTQMVRDSDIAWHAGNWAINTGNGYYGGLRMNLDFQRGYGPELYARKGTADRWQPLEQIWVAERAWKARGFTPWPQTARMCGLPAA